MWEIIDSFSARLKVHRGWIVKSWMGSGYQSAHVHQIFVEDSTHQWKLEEKSDGG